ncbi:MAG: TRL domain-containing protein, partial [Planctomycetota bacterium JB042]
APLSLFLTLSALPGCLYLDIKTTLDEDLYETTLGDKVGKATARSVLFGMVAWGDSGSQAAAEDGGIEILRHADLELFAVFFGIYASRTTVVYGD